MNYSNFVYNVRTWPSSQLQYDKGTLIGNAFTLCVVWGLVRTGVLQEVNFKIDDVFGMNTTLESCTYIEMLWSLLKFDGDTMIHGLLCMMHDISKYRGSEKFLVRPDWKNNLKVAIFRPTRMSLLPRRPGWMDSLLNCFWVACNSYSLVAVACVLPGLAKDLSAPRYKSVFWPIRHTSCHIFSNRSQSRNTVSSPLGTSG